MGEPEEYNRKELIHRIGTFFLMLAVGLVVYFVLSDAAGSPAFSSFCSGVILATLGFILRAQLKRPVPPSGRFGFVKGLFRKKE